MRIEGLQFVVALLGTLLALFLVLYWRRSRVSIIAISVVLLGTVAGVGSMELYRPTRVSEEEVADRPIQVRENGYVSSKTCKACHPEQYASWFRSYHRTMTQVASPETVIGRFDGRLRSSYGQKFRLERHGDEFFVEMDNPDTGAGQPARVRRPVVMTTGSHHMQTYWYATGDSRKVSLVPFVHLREDGRWIPERASYLKPPLKGFPDFRGLWNRGCQQCHATATQPHVDDMDTRVAELGIACEACHGPAEEHVRRNRSPDRRYRLHLGDGRDPTIINPKRISAERSAEICGQCHGLWQAVDKEESDRSFDSGFTYLPGQELGKSKFMFHQKNLAAIRARGILRENKHYVEDRFWSDGILRVAGREFTNLLDTPCFNHDDPEKERLSCLHCHALHKPRDDPRPLEEWADDQLKPRMDGNEACLQCHDDRENVEEHTHHPAGSSGSVCYNCHMTYTSYALLKAIRSHTVDSPSVATSVKTGRPNACNQCHLDKTMAWAADHLEEWYGIRKPELTAEHKSIAASVLWILKGDAGQRALMAWSMGWEDARKASRPDWMIPYVAQLLVDPYDAVRYIAYRSLRALPGCSRIKYDFVGAEEQRDAALQTALLIWRKLGGGRTTGSQLLIDADGKLNRPAWQRLIEKRDHRRVSLEE